MNSNDYLLTKINKIEQEYSQCLKLIKAKMNSNNLEFILDEINLFWYSNRNIIELFLKHISEDFSCYTFTGGTFLDVDDYEHFPFATLGRVHIIDDPLHKYTQILSKVQNKIFYNQLKEQLVLTIDDNIKIIDNYLGNLYILPVTLLSDNIFKISCEISKKAFLSMFKDSELSIEKYLKNYKNIEDISNGLIDEIKNGLLFSDNMEEIQLDFISRYKKYEFHESLPPEEQKNEVLKFWIIMNGYIAQIVDIILICTQYNMVPYIRGNLTFDYMMKLWPNFKNLSNIEETIFRSICAHVLYIIFDKTKVEKIEFSEYIKTLNQKGFTDELFKEFKMQHININNMPLSIIAQTIQEKLSNIINLLTV